MSAVLSSDGNTIFAVGRLNAGNGEVGVIALNVTDGEWWTTRHQTCVFMMV